MSLFWMNSPSSVVGLTPFIFSSASSIGHQEWTRPSEASSSVSSTLPVSLETVQT